MGSRRLGPSQLSGSRKKLGSPGACRVLSVAFPELLTLPSLLAPGRVMRGPGPWWDAQLKPSQHPAGEGSREGRLPRRDCWGQLPALLESPSKQILGKGKLQKLVGTPPVLSKTTQGHAEHYRVGWVLLRPFSSRGN